MKNRKQTFLQTLALVVGIALVNVQCKKRTRPSISSKTSTSKTKQSNPDKSESPDPTPPPGSLEKIFSDEVMKAAEACSPWVKTVINNIKNGTQSVNAPVLEEEAGEGESRTSLQTTTPLCLVLSSPTEPDKVLIKALLEAGASFAKKSRLPGETPLHIAASKGYTRSIQAMIEKDENAVIETINEGDHYGSTPLHTAVEDGQVAVVELIQQYNPNLQAEDNDKKNPLQLAQEKCEKATKKDKKKKWEKINDLLE